MKTFIAILLSICVALLPCPARAQTVVINPFIEFPGGGAPFDPSSISGLVLWLRADAVGGGLSDGDPVATWEDAHTSNNDATQADSGKRPTYETGEINALPVVRFDGSNDTMDGVATSSAARTLFIVAKKRTAAALQTDVIFSFTGNIDSVIFTNTGFFAQWGYYNPATSMGGTATDPTVLTLNFATISSVVPSVNGTEGSAFDPSDQYQVGDPYRLGGTTSTPDNPSNVDIAEVLIYNVSLSTGDKEDVEDYLGGKYGIAITH